MLEDPRPPLPPLVATREAPAPAPEVHVVDGTELPQPTAEQARSADEVFTGPVQRDPVTTLFGVITSALLLRDIAVDTFETKDDEDERGNDEREEADPAD